MQPLPRHSTLRLWLTVVAWLSIAASAEAASVTIAWDPSPDTSATGYTLFYGLQPGVYATNVNVGNRTQVTLVGLAPGTYYFTVEAYDANGLSSERASEVSGIVKVQPLPASPAPDLDGDHMTDLLVWRASTGTWFWLSSSAGYTASMAGSKEFGDASLGDIPLSGDIDGDHVADLVLWRAATGTWMWRTSLTGFSEAGGGSRQWGNASLGDVPMLADVDGDEAADLVVWRASTGMWYWLTSSTGYNQAFYGGRQWGNQSLGDVPMVGDFDGDRRADLAVWRKSTGTWYWLNSSQNYSYEGAGGRQWGNQSLGDVPLIGDFDGDHKSDMAVWRGSTGTWFWLSSNTGYSYNAAGGIQWGNQSLGDKPALTDMDGDGRADLCVWRPETGTWYWLNSSARYSHSAYGARQWGSVGAGDIPVVK